jgi:beta-lactamase regulating signal transducer with metallopeptidase domain
MMLVLADLALKATFLLALGAFAAFCVRRNASLKRQVWVAAFLAVPLCALARLLVPARVHLATVKTPLTPVSTLDRLGWESWLLFVWLAGFIAVACYGVGCWRALSRLRAKSQAVGGLDLRPLSDQAAVTRSWELRISDASTPQTALTWGWRKPVVLLPRGAAEWEDSRMRVVLLHELAHVRQADGIVQILVLFVCAAFWFNPLVWLAARAYRSAAEAAADEAVLLAGVRPTEYAAVLLALVSECAAMRRVTPLGAAMVGRSGIEDRIRAIVAVRPGIGARRGQGLSIAGFAALILCGLASFQVAIAQQEFIPDFFKGRSKEWIQGYQSAQSYLRETGATPRPMSAEERYHLEKRLSAAYDLERRLNGG